MSAAANTISLIAANDGGHTLLADTSVSHHHDPQWLRCPHELWPFSQGSRPCNKSVAGLQAFNCVCYENTPTESRGCGIYLIGNSLWTTAGRLWVVSRTSSRRRRHAFPPNSTSSQVGRLTRELSLTRHFG